MIFARLSAAMTVAREQVETKPPKRQPAAAHPPGRCRRPARPHGPDAPLLVQLPEAGSVQTSHDLGATLSHGAPHKGPGVGWRVARLVGVRCRKGRSDPSPAQRLAVVKPPQRATPARISAGARPPITLARGDDSRRAAFAFEIRSGPSGGEDQPRAPWLPFAALPGDPQQDS